MTLQILTVCSGNICRSPMAEQLLRARLSDRDKLAFSSAGTMALSGAPMDGRAAQLATERGSVDAEQHVAREISLEMIRSADLILAMAREHRRSIVEALPRAVRKTFTIREFARIVSSANLEEFALSMEQAGTDVSARFDAAIQLAAGERGMFPANEPGDDDVVDPYRRDDATYRTSTDQLVPAVDATAEFLDRVVRVDSEH
ncbi:low molecular weight phosphatase family protein [Paramicrobacterium agarici]|uniref:arsenate reductase/protein-tyrosine-phosphatase family protein n=1 Tax=Paramicrobacterium agarici TaxID=630514 RepID=UPI001150D993|nr:low molecular weight phosphatase family protein [Microbacterium agarici]TQO23683.1 protein-tyrosine phosphatase [Microbacterium agarici]